LSVSGIQAVEVGQQKEDEKEQAVRLTRSAQLVVALRGMRRDIVVVYCGSRFLMELDHETRKMITRQGGDAQDMNRFEVQEQQRAEKEHG